MYFGDLYYDGLWDYMGKEYYVVIRKPRQKGPTIWTGPNSEVNTYKDMEGWNRIKDTIERRLESIVGSKPEWVRSQNAFKVPLTESQAVEIKKFTDVKGVVEVK